MRRRTVERLREVMTGTGMDLGQDVLPGLRLSFYQLAGVMRQPGPVADIFQ